MWSYEWKIDIMLGNVLITDANPKQMNNPICYDITEWHGILSFGEPMLSCPREIFQ